MSTPPLAIVIVNFRCWDDLDACLESLAGLDAEIVVVDNASDDGRLDEYVRRYPQVRFIGSGGNHGYAYGCNCGAAATSAPELLFLNPDARDPGGAIEQALALKAGQPRTLLALRQIDETGEPQRVFDAFPSLLTLFGPIRWVLRRLLPERYPQPRRRFEHWMEVDWVSGSALFIDRAALEELGGWCEDYWMYSEDVDLCRRARNRGMRVVFSTAATIVHRRGSASHRSLEVRGITRAETVISRHLYAHRHLGPVHAAVYHAALVLTRLLPAFVFGLLPVAAFQPRRDMARHLLDYYRRAWSRGDWRSPRAVQRG